MGLKFARKVSLDGEKRGEMRGERWEKPDVFSGKNIRLGQPVCILPHEAQGD